jgi:hypothetical protein
MNFIEYLTNYEWDNYPPEEFNEVRIVLYRILARAITDECDMLTLTPSNVEWSKKGRVMGRFPMTITPTPSLEELMNQIIRRDKVTAKHIHLFSKDSIETTYHISKEPL